MKKLSMKRPNKAKQTPFTPELAKQQVLCELVKSVSSLDLKGNVEVHCGPAWILGLPW